MCVAWIQGPEPVELTALCGLRLVCPADASVVLHAEGPPRFLEIGVFLFSLLLFSMIVNFMNAVIVM